MGEYHIVRTIGTFFFLSLFMTGCLFRPTPFRGVTSYRDGHVFIKRHWSYTVGFLPEGWKRQKTKRGIVSFYHPEWKSSVSTEAFCSPSISDRRLESLATESASAIEKRNHIREEAFILDGRGALRLVTAGSLDGVSVELDTVVVKKDGCAFSFYLVQPPGASPQGVQDFEYFFKGFHYEGRRKS